jgi:hypothetical protein
MMTADELQELCASITQWASCAISYEAETEIIKEIICNRFRTKAEMMTQAIAIKASLELSLSLKDRNTLVLSSAMMASGESSPDKKALMTARKNVQNKINRLLHRLGHECFPSFREDTDDSIPSKTTFSKKSAKSIRTNDEKFALDDFDNLTISTKATVIEEPEVLHCEDCNSTNNVTSYTYGMMTYTQCEDCMNSDDPEEDDDGFTRHVVEGNRNPLRTRSDEDILSYLEQFEDERGTYLIEDRRTEEEKEACDPPTYWNPPLSMSDSLIMDHGLYQNPLYAADEDIPQKNPLFYNYAGPPFDKTTLTRIQQEELMELNTEMDAIMDHLADPEVIEYTGDRNSDLYKQTVSLHEEKFDASLFHSKFAPDAVIPLMMTVRPFIPALSITVPNVMAIMTLKNAPTGPALYPPSITLL